LFVRMNTGRPIKRHQPAAATLCACVDEGKPHGQSPQSAESTWYNYVTRAGVSSSSRGRGSTVGETKTNKLRGPTATCRRKLVPAFVDREVSRGQRGGSPAVINLSFLDQSRYCYS
jgi:hypothetical protein